MSTAEPLFDYHFQNPTNLGGHYGWRFQAGRFGPQTPYEPGDVVIAFVVARTSQFGSDLTTPALGPSIRVEGISTDGSDWIQDADYQFMDDGSGFSPDPHHDKSGYYAVAAFHKVWTADDDPDTYLADFTGIDLSDPAQFQEVQFLMYLVHGGGTSPAFSFNDIGAMTGPFAGASFVGNFGDGSSSWTSDYGYADTATSEDMLHKPGAWDGYYVFNGVNVYLWTQFGSWYFTYNDTFSGNHWLFSPADSIDNDFGEGGTQTVVGSSGFDFITMNILDALKTSGVRADRRVGQIHRLSVS